MKNNKLVVLDLSTSTCNFYDLPEGDSEQIEEFIYSQGHKLSECSWAVINQINNFVEKSNTFINNKVEITKQFINHYKTYFGSINDIIECKIIINAGLVSYYIDNMNVSKESFDTIVNFIKNTEAKY